jgi:hypothetical protein
VWFVLYADSEASRSDWNHQILALCDGGDVKLPLAVDRSIKIPTQEGSQVWGRTIRFCLFRGFFLSIGSSVAFLLKNNPTR